MDDMDKLLGTWGAVPETQRLLGDQGATADNWFIHTPVCCPSRAELLTGRYFHNIKQATKKGGCMFAQNGNTFYNDWYFGPHLQQAGYTVGIFGKHLNGGNPACPPPGVDRWFANGGGNYNSPTFSDASAGSPADNLKFNNCSYNEGSCYSTSVIGNTSLAWLRAMHSLPASGRKPYFAYIAVKAPHIQDGPGWPVTLPAPWYRDLYPGKAAPRTPNWNASCPKHHWMIRQQPPMTAEEAEKSDALYRARWQSLKSVDDLVVAVVGECEGAKKDATFYVFTSDHGFRFGQYRMPEGKWNAYDNDLRIPFVVRGPGIAAGTHFDHIGSNVDTMPTILGLAGVKTPASMDGRSLAPLLLSDTTRAPPPALRLHRPAAQWRTELLVEYPGLGGTKGVVRYQHIEDCNNNTFRALRVLDPSAAAGRRNLKLVEFTDGVANWNFTRDADEFELFDLDADPWEMDNLYDTAPADLVAQLRASLVKLYGCEGTACN